VRFKTPLTEEDARSLEVGQKVELSGTIVTARDMAHKYLAEGGEIPFDLNVIYHCGPIVKDNRVLSAGPTTSIREEPYEADVIRKFNVRAIIGKGGMGEKTLDALEEYGCVYLTAVGGAGALIAQRIKSIKQAFKLAEFGAPEAFWVFEVEDLPLIVSMDSNGESLHREVEGRSAANFKRILHNQ